eukprot:gnl/MRDRNA2_/MRDRNA2_27837_c0_seq1.p1 gnl/MRDRNA2_/MRDRNA2_27837_c0~~gnl/MRDRNA2_/MRDRNA2_27837_c0_seq1.p1  ORF type:complete len:240 (+),score=54.77 gnl/MRDRNA2_/MRDRNA2_27837_c0_seq1:96-815(+)
MFTQKIVTEQEHLIEGQVHVYRPPPGTKLPRLSVKVSVPVPKELPSLSSTISKLLEDEDFTGMHDYDKAARPFIIFMEAEKIGKDERSEEVTVADLPGEFEPGEKTPPNYDIHAVMSDHFDVGEVGQEHMVVIRTLAQAPTQLRVEVGDPLDLEAMLIITPAMGKWQSFAGYCKPQKISNILRFTVTPIKGQDFLEDNPPCLAIDFVEIRRVEHKVRLGRPDLDACVDPRDFTQAIREH